MKWRTSKRDEEETVADTVLRAASLLRGGVPTSRVWQVLGGEGIVPPADPGPEWRVLTAVWHLAGTSGAPLAPALERLAAALRDLARVGERREVLLSGPRATIRLVGWLPLVAMGLGTLLGFDPFPLLLTPIGAVLAVCGVGLLVAGIAWARALAAALERVDCVAGLEFELVWIALGGGAPPSDAVRRVAESVDRERADWVRLGMLRRDGPVWAALNTAADLGTPVGPMLLGAAESARTRARTEIESAAERLGVRVLIPLAVCILPAFIVLGVVPVLFAVLDGVIG